jgi:hypothetical protein
LTLEPFVVAGVGLSWIVLNICSFVSVLDPPHSPQPTTPSSIRVAVRVVGVAGYIPGVTAAVGIVAYALSRIFVISVGA